MLSLGNGEINMSEWISVKKKRPEISSFVDVFVKSKDNPNYGQRYTDVLYNANDEFCVHMPWRSCYVSHWMPITSPSKD
jgi:hypothetical protein